MPSSSCPGRTSRRNLLQQGAAIGAIAALGPPFAAPAFAQADELAAYKSARINWRQAEGEAITVAVIPASYFLNLISLQPQFEALTGVKLEHPFGIEGNVGLRPVALLGIIFKSVLDHGNCTRIEQGHCLVSRVRIDHKNRNTCQGFQTVETGFDVFFFVEG